MNEQLKLLIDIQKIDSAIISTRHTINEIPKKISSFEGPLKEAQAAYEKTKQQYAALEKQKKSKEDLINEINEKIKKLKQRSSEIKTNKEYQAHLKEIEQAEKSLRSVEDELLSIMDSMDGISRSLERETSKISEEKNKIETLKRELDKEISRYEDDLKRLKEERKRLIDKIDKDIYDEYMSLLKSCRGLAIAEAKNEICMGCNLHIPPQLFVRIKSNEDINRCPQCRRILYYSKEAQKDSDTPEK